MATIMSLSYEVINIILEYVSIKDIENFSSTCKKFRQTIWSNKMWMTKLYQSWPCLKIFYHKMPKENLEKLDYKEEVKEVAKCAKEVWRLISQISMDNLGDLLIIDKKSLILNFLYRNRQTKNYFIVTNELRRIMLPGPWTYGCTLGHWTHRYYSCHILRQVKYYRTKHKLLQFKNRNKYHKVLEKIVTLLVQWFNIDNDISYTHIVKPSLEYIAEKVLQALKEEYPSHSIFTIFSVFHNYWKKHNIFYTYWDYEEILAILNILERIVFSPTNFHKLNQIWKKSHENVSECVISEGTQSIFFLTIYHSVIRRLGIYSIVATSNILQIFLKSTDISKHPDYFCVKLRNRRFYVENNIRGSDHHRNVLVDHILLQNNPCNMLKVVPLLNEFLKLESNLKKKDQLILQQIMEREDEDITDLIIWEPNVNIKKSQPERRSARLKFIIGTVVSHAYDDYSRIHFGVIVGWNNFFNLNSVSGIEFSILPDNYTNISCGNIINCTDYMCSMHKPYYIIFCNNNEYCYVPQENISMCSSKKWIHHDEIGRYFSKYEYIYYIPNKMLARDYPQDVAIINEIMRTNNVNSLCYRSF